jgi:hypothetical protein
MRLQISHDDETGFERAKDQLLDSFGRWLHDERQLDDALAGEAVGDAGIALDWKFGYDDGHLGRWTGGDVAEFLLRWCPRKLSVSQEDSMTIPGSVAAFTDYLAAQGLLAPGSSSAAALREAATNAAADFVAEMGNPANFGMAKSLFAAAAANGYDLTDEASVAAWMNDFNSLSDDERKAILPDRVFGDGGGAAGGVPGWPAGVPPAIPPLPPVVLPPEEAIEESRAAAPVLTMFARLAEFVGTGRRLTQVGNLSLADAKELVRLLDTGDAVDERIGERVFRTRSSVDLPVLRLVFTWARKAGVVRVTHGKVLATKRGLALAANPAGMFDRAVDALLKAGPVTAQRHPKAWPFWPDIDHTIDGMVLPLLIRLYVERDLVPLTELTEAAAQAILKTFVFGTWPDKEVTAHVGWLIAAAMDALELAGVVRRTRLPGDDHDPAVRRADGEVELTPAGMAAVQRLLVAAGFDAPVAGRWADASAEELLTGADRDDWMSLCAEIDVWRQRRAPEQALAELAAVVRQVADPTTQNIALTIMSDIGPELAAPYVREMANEQPSVRGFALCWLADHSMLDAKEVYDPGDLDSFAYVLAHRLVTAGNDGLLACLAVVGDETAQAQVVGDLGRKAAPPVGAVLEAIGGTHPVKSVAKAARKALFLMRSRLADQAR